MLNVGEQLVSSYLRYIRECEFVHTNVYTTEAQGEIDVVGINLKTREVYICEVAVHLVTGLRYNDNISKLSQKFSRDIQYAEKYLQDYRRHYLLWSPVVKDSQGDTSKNQLHHLAEVQAHIHAKHGVAIVCVVNQAFEACLRELREYAGRQTAEMKCPLMRLMQIEELLGRHVARGRGSSTERAMLSLDAVLAKDAPEMTTTGLPTEVLPPP